MSREKAMIPVVVTVLATVIILIVWTIIDPWRWTREWVSDIPAETYGQCQSDHFWAFFAPLISILVLAEGLTIFFVYKTADINDDFSDTRPSIYAMYSQFQAWIVGVPILVVIDNGSTDAVFLSRSLLIWIFSLSGVVFVIVPRIYNAAYKRAHPEEITIASTLSGGGYCRRSTPLLAWPPSSGCQVKLISSASSSQVMSTWPSSQGLASMPSSRKEKVKPASLSRR